jgi:hypothetical protein
MDSNSTFHHSLLSTHIFSSHFPYTNAEVTDVKGDIFTGFYPLFPWFILPSGGAHIFLSETCHALRITLDEFVKRKAGSDHQNVSGVGYGDLYQILSIITERNRTL